VAGATGMRKQELIFQLPRLVPAAERPSSSRRRARGPAGRFSGFSARPTTTTCPAVRPLCPPLEESAVRSQNTGDTSRGIISPPQGGAARLRAHPGVERSTSSPRAGARPSFLRNADTPLNPQSFQSSRRLRTSLSGPGPDLMAADGKGKSRLIRRTAATGKTSACRASRSRWRRPSRGFLIGCHRQRPEESPTCSSRSRRSHIVYLRRAPPSRHVSSPRW